MSARSLLAGGGHWTRFAVAYQLLAGVAHLLDGVAFALQLIAFGALEAGQLHELQRGADGDRSVVLARVDGAAQPGARGDLVRARET